MLSSCISAIFLYCCIFVLGVAIMVYGWGLTPQNWWWITGGMLGQVILASLMQTVIKETKN